MKIAKKKDSKFVEVTASCKAREYQLMHKRIHGALIERGLLLGRECQDFYALCTRVVSGTT